MVLNITCVVSNRIFGWLERVREKEMFAEHAVFSKCLREGGGGGGGFLGEEGFCFSTISEIAILI